MKAHEDTFEGKTMADIPVLESGAMVRKGRVGDATADGMTTEISAHLRAVGSQMCPDARALEWFYAGGPLPA